MAEKRLLGREARRFRLPFFLDLESGGRGKVGRVNFAFHEKRVSDCGKTHAENPLEPPEVVGVIDSVNAIERGEFGELPSADLVEHPVRIGESPRGFGQPEGKQPLRLED